MKLHAEIGRGGVGVVYLALKRWRGGLTRWFAVQICTDWQNLDEHWAAYQAEGALLERFSKSSKIIQVWRWDRTPDLVPFKVMKLAGGRSLRESLTLDGAIGARRLVGLGIQIAEILEEVHQRGLIHLDLEPGNIFLIDEGTADEQVSLSDFSLAIEPPGMQEELGYHAIRLRRDAEQGIPPRFVAPELTELLEGSIETAMKGADERADIYSAGMVLYHALTNRSPFGLPATSSLEQWFRAHRVIEPLHPREWNPSLPEELCRVVMRCLEKSPHDRFQSAAELRLAFMTFLDRDEISVLRSHSEELEQQTRGLRTRVEELESRLLETEQALAAAEETLSDAMGSGERAERRVSRAETRAEDYARELDATKHLLDELRVSKLRETASRLEAEGRVSALQDKTEKLLEVQEHLDRKYREVRDTFHAKLQAFTKVNREKADLAEERDRLAESMKENAELQAELERKRLSAETAFKSSREQRARLENDVTKLTEDYWNAIAQAKDEKTRRERAERIAEEREQQRTGVEERADRERQQREEAEGLVADLTRGIESLEEELKNAQTEAQDESAFAEEREELERERDEAATERNRALALVTAEKAYRRETERQARSFEKRYKAAAEQLSKARETASALEKNLEATTRELKRALPLVEEEKSQREKAERHVVELNDKLWNLTGEMVQTQDASRESEKQVRDVQTKLEQDLRRATENLKREKKRAKAAVTGQERAEKKANELQEQLDEIAQELEWIRGIATEEQQAREAAVKQLAESKFLLNKYRALLDPLEGDDDKPATGRGSRATKLVKTKRLLSAEIKAHKETSSRLRTEAAKAADAALELDALKKLLSARGDDD